MIPWGRHDTGVVLRVLVALLLFVPAMGAGVGLAFRIALWVSGL